MKKSIQGFTLIELLAVIVILSIIAVITVPMIMNVIDKAKLGALEDSAYGLVESANLYYSENISNITDKVMFDFKNGEQTSITKLSYKGKIDNGKVILNTDGKIVTCIDNGTNYAYKELSESKVVTGKGTCSYDGNTGDFTIVSDTDTLNKKVIELQNEISNGKGLISTAITNQGVETSSTDSFETMASNIDKLDNKPKGMFRLVLTSADVKAQLENTYIDYTKLTSDNFFYTARANLSGYHARNTNYMGWKYSSTGVITLSYNNTSGVVSATNPTTYFYHNTGTEYAKDEWHADAQVIQYILCCDISTTLKDNWQDYIN